MSTLSITAETNRTGKTGIILKSGVILSCCAGIWLQLSEAKTGSAGMIFRAFTIQSNIWIAALSFVFIILTRKRWKARPSRIRPLQQGLPQRLYVIKLMFTTSILLTYLVFAVLLAPFMEMSYLLSLSNICLHTLTPLLALLDFILCSGEYSPSKKEIWSSLIMPAAYAVFFFILYEIRGSLPVPYFFLDYKTLGWFTAGADSIGVVYWLVLLFGVLLGITASLWKLKRAAEKRPVKTSLLAAGMMIFIAMIPVIIAGEVG